jgi:predicted MPP superfamily phosphohydrolase
MDMSARNRDADMLRALPAPLGKFAVTGNHEFYRGGAMSLRFFEAAGFTTLRGAFAEAGGIVVAGVDDAAFAGPQGSASTDEAALLRKVPHGPFILFMNHRPLVAAGTVGAFDLQYSGHTHGGQIWPGTLITKSIYGMGQGLSVLREGARASLLYVSDGLGFWGPPIRLMTSSEITLILLRHGPELTAKI